MAHSHLRQVAKSVAPINLHISLQNLERYQKAIMFKPYSCGDHLDVEVEINSTGGYMIAHVFRFAQADLNLWQSHPEVGRHRNLQTHSGFRILSKRSRSLSLI